LVWHRGINQNVKSKYQDLCNTVEAVLVKRATEVAEGRERESAENFTRNILNTTNNLLLSSIGWQEITNQSNRFDTTSKIFRLVMLFPILHLSKQTPLLYTKFVPVAIISYVSARQNLFIVATVNIRAF
jgi:hypothetical protein